MLSPLHRIPFLAQLHAKAQLWRSAWQARGELQALPRGNGRPPREAADYRRYLVAQIAKSRLQAQPDAEVLPRTRRLAGLLAAHLPPGDGEVLCVGCRDRRELDEIERQTGRAAAGVDLFSGDPRIVIGDFHHLPFADGVFAAIYSCHSLEHAYDRGLALAELSRVLRPGGLWAIEVPIAFELCATDRQDYGSAAALAAALPGRGEILFQEDAARGDGKRRDARLVARKSIADTREED
jgi:SAM-dependent methyltransferase